MADEDDAAEILRLAPSLSSSETMTQHASLAANQTSDGLEITLSPVDFARTILFRNHRDDKYVWPYELCLSFEAIKPLLEEAYTLLGQESYIRDVKAQRYDILTDDGRIILPSVWGDIVQPFSTIRISFFPIDYQQETYVEEHPQNASASELRIQKYDIVAPSPVLSAITSGDEESGLEEYESEFETESESSQDTKLPEPPREITVPVDTDGNNLSFKISTASRRRPEQPLSNIDAPRGKSEASEHGIETLRIIKTTAAASDNRNMIRIHSLPGPENSNLRDDISVTWYHIPAARLDFTRFRNVCLTVPGLSSRMQTLVRAMLRKIEQHKIKAFLNGLFIEPGTVLRAEEDAEEDPQSVIFSCVPYLDLHPPAKEPSSGAIDRLFPTRTLMQSYYPYEPVEERDQDQAYVEFSGKRSGAIINVPELWILNIGSNVVVTCGHDLLTQDLIKSIEVVKEDVSQLGTIEITKSSLTTIRLTDWEQRVMLFPLWDCRSYFQFEQKVRELKSATKCRFGVKGLKLIQRDLSGDRNVKPGNWSELVGHTDRLFLNLMFVNDKSAAEVPDLSSIQDVETPDTNPIPDSVPPFFRWPTRLVPGNAIGPDFRRRVIILPNTDMGNSCLDHAEKGMVTVTLSSQEIINDIDKAFTTTAYYRSLPEDSYEHASAQIAALKGASSMTANAATTFTYHEKVINTQCDSITARTKTFVHHVHATLLLFTSDLDQNAMLRKVWGACMSIHDLVTAIEARTGQKNDVSRRSTPRRCKLSSSQDGRKGWYIRNDITSSFRPAPEAARKFKHSLERCMRCQSYEPFDTSEAAVSHLKQHVKSASPNTSRNTEASYPSQKSSEPINTRETPELDLEEWVLSYAEARQELTNAGTLAILFESCQTAEQIFVKTKELAEGVRNENGSMSELYTLPYHMTAAFRVIVVYYLAVERALFYTENAYNTVSLPELRAKPSSIPFSSEGLAVLSRFGDGARHSLYSVRVELCNMVASPGTMDVLAHLSLGPQYVCAWLMRRLIVKPLEGDMTAGDMYREYLSTVQFQVNHRPGKRLIRAINLLSEELRVLHQVNTWQQKLVQNYSQVLDDASYEKLMPARRTMFSFERSLLESCLDNLNSFREEYNELIRRCSPLSESTKQSLEINEEDHGKAIMVFTVVTVIFLPLSFVTSYLGMNTNDIRNMNNQQSLFWIVALPLTIGVMAACLLISFNGDQISDRFSGLYRTLTSKQDRSTSARGISVAQRRRAQNLRSGTDSSLDFSAVVDEAEYASPRPDFAFDEYSRKGTRPATLELADDTIYLAASQPQEEKISSMAESRSQRRTFSSIRPMRVAAAAMETPPPPAPLPRPSYTRIHKRFVDEEALRYHNLQFNMDSSDPDYYLIKQSLGDTEIRDLVQHSDQRRVRSGAYDGRNMGGQARLIASMVEDGTLPVSSIRMAEWIPAVADEDEDGGPRGYTWHKKRTRRRAPGLPQRRFGA